MKEFNCVVKLISFIMFVILGILSILSYLENDPKGISQFVATTLTYYAINFLLMGIFLSIKKTNLIKGMIFTLISISYIVYIFALGAGAIDGLIINFFPILFTIVPFVVTIRSIKEIKHSKI